MHMKFQMTISRNVTCLVFRRPRVRLSARRCVLCTSLSHFRKWFNSTLKQATSAFFHTLPKQPIQPHISLTQSS